MCCKDFRFFSFQVAEVAFGNHSNQLSGEDAKLVRDAEMVVVKRDRAGLGFQKKKDKVYPAHDKPVQSAIKERRPIICFCCGEKDHIAKKCPKKDETEK